LSKSLFARLRRIAALIAPGMNYSVAAAACKNYRAQRSSSVGGIRKSMYAQVNYGGMAVAPGANANGGTGKRGS
jgi:hypothetical protein